MMTRVCTICSHVNRQVIDRHLVARTMSIRDIAGQFRVSKSAVSRHRKACLPTLLVRAYRDEENERADELLRTAKGLLAKSIKILQTAEQQHDWYLALAGIRESRNTLSLLAEIEGQIDRTTQINITVLPEWVELRMLILDVLRPYAEARQDLVTALRKRDTNGISP